MTPNNSDQAAMHDELRARLLASVSEWLGIVATDGSMSGVAESRLHREIGAALSIPPPAAHAGGEAVDYMKLSQDATNELWSVTLRREYESPGQKKRAIERVIRGSVESALNLPSTVDGWEGGVDPMMNEAASKPTPNPHDTHPSPMPVDALRELVAKWRAGVALAAQFEAPQEMLDAYEQCADELTALLSSGAAREE